MRYTLFTYKLHGANLFSLSTKKNNKTPYEYFIYSTLFWCVPVQFRFYFNAYFVFILFKFSLIFFRLYMEVKAHFHQEYI